MSAAARVRKRSFIKSIQACDEELASNPQNATLLSRRAEAKRKIGLYDSAIADFDAALVIKPAFATALAGRGSAKRALGRCAEAVEDFTRALRLEPRSGRLLTGRSLALRGLGRSEEAISDLDAAVKFEPHSAVARQARGELRRKLGDFEAALKDFNSALRCDPQCAAALAGRGAAKRALGRQYECVEDFDAALRLEPRNGAVLAGRGGARLELGRYEEALQDFEKVLAEHPADAYALWGRGMALRHEGRIPLQTLTLTGFGRRDLNVKYVERRQPEFSVNDCETYWSEGGHYFLYWCKKESRWKGTSSDDLPEVQGGRNSGLIGSPPGADILSPGFSKGWYEWDGKAWVTRSSGGISTIGQTATVSQTLRLAGFTREDLNVEYVERSQPDFTVSGRETYWSVGGNYFLYYCKKESRWKGSRSGDLAQVMAGRCCGFIGSRAGSDILNPSLYKGWHEWDGHQWRFLADGGILSADPPRAEASGAEPREKKRHKAAA